MIKQTLFSKILQSLIDASQLGLLLFGGFTLLSLINLFVDDRILEKAFISAVLFGIFRFIQLQFFSKK